MQIRHPSPIRLGSRRGTAATELALMLPLLVLLLLGCVDFGRVGYYAIALANAAGTAAQYGATHRVTALNASHWENEIRDIIEEELSAGPKVDPDSLKVFVTSTDEGNGDVRVRVEARCPFETIVAWPGLPHSIELSRACVFRQYQ